MSEEAVEEMLLELISFKKEDALIDRFDDFC